MDEPLVRAAKLDEARLSALFDKAARNDRFQRRIVGPAGWIAMGLFIPGLLAPKPVADILLLPFAAALLTFMVGDRIMNKAPEIRAEIRKAAMDRLVTLDAGGVPAPTPAP